LTLPQHASAKQGVWHAAATMEHHNYNHY